MIDKLHLLEYQSHADTTLEFSSGLNVIIGASDKGKTSILRALDWIINNRPGGDAFRRRGTKETEVAIELDEKRVVRHKGKTNDYRIGDITLTGFGQTVPEEVSSLLNMGAINTQRQFDGPFLLTESSGEVARRLNEIADLQIIDITIANNNRDLRKVTTDIGNYEQLIEESKEQVGHFAFLDKLEKELDKLLSFEEEQHIIETAAELLRRALDKIQYQLQQPTYEWVETAETEMIVLDRTMNAFLKVHSEWDALRICMNKTEDTTKDMEFQNRLLQAEKPVQRLEKLLAHQNSMKEQANKLESLLVDISRAEEAIAGWSEKTSTLKEQWDVLMPDECPLCGAPKNWWNE